MVKSTSKAASEKPASTGISTPAPETSPSWSSIEGLLWLGLLLVATVLRLWDLGGQPLSALEAANALSSWQMVRSQGAIAGEPLLVYWNTLTFLAFGAGDAVARLLPALAGIVLVAMPYFLRRELGRWGALASGILLALSANLIYFSRLAQSQSLSAAAALVAAVCVMRFRDSHDSRWLNAAAAALGVLVLTGAQSLTALLVLAVAGFWVATRGASSASLWHDLRRPAESASSLRGPAVLCAAVVLLGSTGFLANLHGIQEGLIDPFGRWLGAWPAVGRQWQFPLQLLLVYEPAILLFGMLAVARALVRPAPASANSFPSARARPAGAGSSPLSLSRKGEGEGEGILPLPSPASQVTANRCPPFVRRGLRAFLFAWASIAAVLATAGEQAAVGIPLIIVPLALLAGPLVAAVVTTACKSVAKLDLAMYFGVSITLLGLFWVATLFFSMPEQALPASVPVGPFALPLRSVSGVMLQAQIVFLIAALAGFTIWLAPCYWGELLGTLAASVLLVVGIHAATLLGYAPNASPSELVVSSRTSTDIRTLSRDLGSALDAMAINGQPRAVRVDVSNDRLLRWYLREVPSVVYGTSRSPIERVIIKDVGAAPPAGRFGLHRYRLQSERDGKPFAFRAFWRWLLLRETPAALRHQDVVLYIKLQ